jgi:hypothetical protein
VIDPDGEDIVVDRTGIAVVHEGERIRAAPHARAGLRPVGASGADVQLVFPVEVVVVGGIPEEDRRELEARILSALHSALT